MINVVGKLLTVSDRDGETVVRALERSEYPAEIKGILRSPRFGMCNMWCVLALANAAGATFGCQSDDCADECVLTKHVIGTETYSACQCAAGCSSTNIIPLTQRTERSPARCVELR